MLLVLGFGIIYGGVHKIPTHFFKGLSLIGLPVVLVLLGFTLAQGTTIDGANASRWISIPFVGGFQPSNLAAVVLMIYVARYLSKVRDKKVSFTESLIPPLWLPVFLVVVLILPANFSTAAIIFTMVLLLCFLGGDIP